MCNQLKKTCAVPQDDNTSSEDYDTIRVPDTLSRYKVKRLFGKRALKHVHDDFDTAVDMILVFCNLLIRWYDKDNKTGINYKRIHSQFTLISLLGNEYKTVIKILEDKGVVDVFPTYIPKKLCMSYALTEEYDSQKIIWESIESDVMRDRLARYYGTELEEGMDNPIVFNLNTVYSQITVPNISEIMEKGRLLQKDGETTNKNKKIVVRGKRSKSYYNTKNYSIVEDNIDRFKQQTGRWDNGILVRPAYKIMSYGGLDGKSRVVDSFSVMSSWIRSMIKIDGEPIEQNDMSSFHMHIAINMYGGEEEYSKINTHNIHSLIADEYEVKREYIKMGSLSYVNNKDFVMLDLDIIEERDDGVYFNDKFDVDAVVARINSMPEDKIVKRPIYQLIFYWLYNNFPNTLINLVSEKQDLGTHKITSMRMLEKEVEIMKEIIKILNEDYGIYGLYVYDCFYSKVSDKDTVRAVMNQVARSHGLKTIAG